MTDAHLEEGSVMQTACDLLGEIVRLECRCHDMSFFEGRLSGIRDHPARGWIVELQANDKIIEHSFRVCDVTRLAPAGES